MKYYVLYCNFSGGPYDYGIGEDGLRDKFFDICRDRYDFDKYGHSYDEDTKTDFVVYQFDTKEEVIEFISDSRGVTSFTSPEDYKRQQMELAKECIERVTMIRL